MGGIARAITKALGLNKSDEIAAAAAQQQQLQRVAQERQISTLQGEEREGSRSRRAPRGRRLLIAPETGERGVTLG